MTTLQFSLFFVALLVGYLLVHVRLVRFETHLQEISGLKMLNSRLQGVADSMERVRLDRVEELLTTLHDDLARLEESQRRVERAVVRAASSESVAIPRPVMVSSDGAESGPSDRVRGAIEHRLLSLGYGDLRILSDLTEIDLDEVVEVRVECSRDQMPYKGVVVTRNGGVVDVRLRSVAQAFP